MWGNKDRFLELAREMGATRSEAPAGEWDKVLIMGKQIAPEDTLFAGAPRTSTADLDMELHSGTGTFDMNLDSGLPTPTDIDLTGSATVVAAETGLDFVLDEPQRGAVDASSIAPTVETPQIRKRPGLDDTEEVPIESLGLDVGTAQALDDLDRADDITLRTSRAPVDDTVENALLRPRVEDTAKNPVLRPKSNGDETVEEDLLSSTNLMKLSEELMGAEVADTTSQTAIYDLEDVESGMATQETKRLDGQGGVASDYALNEEAATMSEVGTKLDLARAYIDMGDPEGARSILDEVLSEGNASQKQEAQRLMASLP